MSDEEFQRQVFQARIMESLGILAGGVAHDFNNLLQSMLGNVELVCLKMADDCSDKKRLQVVEKSIDRASLLIRQLLLFSGRVAVHRKPTNLVELIKKSVDNLEDSVSGKLDIELALDNGTWPIKADPVYVDQVVMNLVSNAVEAMNGKGQLSLTTKNITLDSNEFPNLEPGSYVSMSVSDTGCGMDKESLDHLYDPFFSTKKGSKKIGLGLACVYGIVKAHHGHITCSSEPGIGTCFEIYWPALPEATVQADCKKLKPELKQGKPSKTILVVDDEADIRELTRDSLAYLGYKVITAESGEQALELYSSSGQSIDMVVLDLNMPGMGGHACLEKLLSMDSQAKVLIASGYLSNGHSRESVRSGATGYIGKPYMLSDLAAKVHDILHE
ncbi:ATP-binding protein [Desulfonatronovibrio hydrogenovorans]|uniref:ATP-binding protein n=1 Tax=Desulfonatronovibrio hydrogenovorans TaxID=53245 RepID=UPI00048D8766|nr:ATP-binding protein [Desulfonatronovibrio hydrogenovorans]